MSATSQFDPQLACVRGNEGLEIAMVFKAQGAAVPHLCLAATNPMPEWQRGTDLNEYARIHVTDAEAVVAALYASLPGGTLDQVLRLLLERRASQLIVRFS